MQNIIDLLEAHQIPCSFKSTFGFECLGCGIQSALILLLRGEIYESIIAYPALLPIIFLFGYLFLHLIFKFRKGAFILKISLIFTLTIQIISYIFRHGFSQGF